MPEGTAELAEAPEALSTHRIETAEADQRLPLHAAHLPRGCALGCHSSESPGAGRPQQRAQRGLDLPATPDRGHAHHGQELLRRELLQGQELWVHPGTIRAPPRPLRGSQ